MNLSISVEAERQLASLKAPFFSTLYRSKRISKARLNEKNRCSIHHLFDVLDDDLHIPLNLSSSLADSKVFPGEDSIPF